MLTAFAEDRLLLIVEGAALLSLQLGYGLVGLTLPLVAESRLEQKGQDVVFVVLPRSLAAKDVGGTPQVSFELLQ